MSEPASSALPLHQLLEALDAWQGDPEPGAAASVRQAFGRLLSAYGVTDAHLLADIPTLPRLEIGFGRLTSLPPADERSNLQDHELHAAGGAVVLGRLWLDVGADDVPAAARAAELALDSAWSRTEARLSERRLGALDAAVRGIAAVGSVERVLQLIVDRVRELVGAQYAALGIVGPFGVIDQFITSGISDEQRARIGALPRGHGLLGLIIREDRSFRIDDIATDPRRYGFPPNHPEMHAFLGVPVRSKGRSIGNLYLTNKPSGRIFSERDQRLVEMFALHAAIAIENARLHEEVQRLVIVDERQRISRDLHDSIIQSLYAVSLSLEDLPELMAESPQEATVRLDAGIDAIHATIRDIRNTILGLTPEILDDRDLAASIASLAAEFVGNTMIDLDVRVPSELGEIPPAMAAHLVAMTREGLSNIARHSGATRAAVELQQTAGALRLTISDNGRGFDVEAARSSEHHGLANLRSRANAMGGTVVVSSEPTAGTRLDVHIPTGDTRQATRQMEAVDGN